MIDALWLVTLIALFWITVLKEVKFFSQIKTYISVLFRII